MSKPRTTQIKDVTATATELNILDGATVSTAELNILDGVTATASELNVLDGITATTTELNYVDGVTSAIQTQLNTKLAATLIDDDTFATATSSNVPSAESVKAYVDANAGGGVKMKAYNTTSTTGVTTAAKLTFDTEVFDTGGDFASSTFTVPEDGFYTVNFRLVVDSGASTAQNWFGYVYINGSPVSRCIVTTEDTSALGSAQISETYDLNATDTIEVYHNGSVVNYDVLGGTDGTIFEVIQLA